MAAKKYIPILFALLLIPAIAYAATATYTNTTISTLPGNQPNTTLTSEIQVPDNFSIADVDATLNLNGAIHFLEIGLTNPGGTRVVLYDHNETLGSGVQFRNTTFDDEGSGVIVGSHDPWNGRFRPQDPLSNFDGTSPQGTWTLDLTYTGTPGTIDLTLRSWILTFAGADPSSIQGTVFQDSNGNAEQDNGETGLENQTIFLDTNNDTELDSDDGEQSTVTNSDGAYQFSNLDVNEYIVRQVSQPDLLLVAPGSRTHQFRTHSGQTSTGIDFANLPETETEPHLYSNLNVVPIQDDGEAARARSTINVPDSFSLADVNVTVNARNVVLPDLEITLFGPDETAVMVYKKESLTGQRLRETTFDDTATDHITNGSAAASWAGTWTSQEPLGVFNLKDAQGNWTLEVKDTNTGNGISGQIDSWTLELRTPIAQEPEPVVLVPGMVTSLNLRTIFANQAGGKWFFPNPSQKIYQALLDQFAQHGFTESENLFIAHYDWRNPVADAATNYLKPIIDQAKQATGASKVDIVAHSMGGLIARSYIQGSDYANDVDQLIILGTPNLGASDGYIAWEGGEFPDRWSRGLRLYLTMVERSLSSLSLNPAKPRPLSLREFFPSLKDLLPVNDFVIRNNSPFAIGQHAEQNLFLQQLRADLNLIEQRGVKVTTIAGNDVPTLNQVRLSGTRTNEDISRQRWRDGHPNPDPPATDTTLGDQTVLLSSALFGTDSLTLNNAAHDKLPEEAQEEVLQALGFDVIGPHIAYDIPESLLGTVVLSPVTPSFTFPNGTIFTCDATKQQENAECIVDEEDPNGPKLLMIADPPTGDYKITLTGTAAGSYHAITCFADGDQDGCTTRDGTTTAGKVETYKVKVGVEDFKAPPEDILKLTEKLWRAIPRLLNEKHLKLQAVNPLLGPASTTYVYANAYQSFAVTLGFEHTITKKYFTLLQQEFGKFKTALDTQITKGYLDTTAILELTGLRDQLQDAGL